MFHFKLHKCLAIIKLFLAGRRLCSRNYLLLGDDIDKDLWVDSSGYKDRPERLLYKPPAVSASEAEVQMMGRQL